MTDTTTATADPTQDPAAIERDIRRTQDEMWSTPCSTKPKTTRSMPAT
jgi:hypothetical protein